MRGSAAGVVGVGGVGGGGAMGAPRRAAPAAPLARAARAARPATCRRRRLAARCASSAPGASPASGGGGDSSDGGSGGGGGSGGNHGDPGDHHGDRGDHHRGGKKRAVVALMAAAAALYATTAGPRRASTPTSGPGGGGAANAANAAVEAPGQQRALRVAVVVPTFNEAPRIGATLAAVCAMSPSPHVVVVSDCGSPDGTAAAARRAASALRRAHGGAPRVHVITSRAKGRAAQLNDGAAAAAAAGADAAIFLHADTSLPQGAVGTVRATLADGRTCLGAFLPLIVGEGDSAAAAPPRTYWAMTAHNFAKSYYAPALMRPLSFARGLRFFFGDQAMFTRLSDLEEVGGFDESLKLMEDGELCVRMHMRLRGRGRGRQCMVGQVAETSGRRFDKFGELHMTLVHFAIGIVWYFAVENFSLIHTDDLAKLCARLYPDVR